MVASQLFILYEHAVGYTLFRVKEYEEIASNIPKVEKASLSLINFKKMVQMVAFSPYKTGNSALENALTIAEGNLHQDLSLFLETNLPKSSKKSKTILGVSDPKIGTAIQESFGVICQHTDVVPELLRGIRQHADSLIDGLTSKVIGSSEAGLARSFSRNKVKFNTNRADNMIIQSISLLDQLDKDINTFTMRLREWYSYHFPELLKLVPDSYMYAKIAKVMGDRKQMDESSLLPQLTEITGDESLSQAVINAAKLSMGMDIAPIDLINISSFSSKVINLVEYRHQLMEYLQSRMHNVAPNLSVLIGETVGARLISHAGSLINLAKYPASTVQILGAEKALFRALKTRGNTPKHGLLFHSSYIARAGAKNKGRISRFLANKCSIASRIDCFNEQPADVFGALLKDQVEERLKFYESGAIPKKNLDVMKEATDRARQLAEKRAKKLKKKAKKQAAAQEIDQDESMVVEENNESSKKKKKKKVDENGLNETLDQTMENEEPETPQEASSKKKKKKRKNSQVEGEATMDDVAEDGDQNQTPLPSKKKKKLAALEQEEIDNGHVEETPGSKKKKKKKSIVSQDE